MEWGSYRLIESLDENKVKKALVLIETIADSHRFREEVRSLIENADEICTSKRDVFETRMKEVIKSIELGNTLKGECRFCP